MADGVGTAYLGRSFFAALKFVKAELRALVPKPQVLAHLVRCGEHGAVPHEVFEDGVLVHGA